MQIREVSGMVQQLKVGAPFIGFTKEGNVIKTSPVQECIMDKNGVYVKTQSGTIYASGEYYKGFMREQMEQSQANQYMTQTIEADARNRMAAAMLDHAIQGRNPQFLEFIDKNNITLMRSGFTYRLTEAQLDNIQPGDKIQMRVKLSGDDIPKTLTIPNVQDIKFGQDGSMMIASRSSFFTDCKCIAEYNRDVNRYNDYQSMGQMKNGMEKESFTKQQDFSSFEIGDR